MNSHSMPSLCIVGNRVLAEPGNHPAIVLASSAASCRLHYIDGAFPDSWDFDFNLKATDSNPTKAAMDSKAPAMGRFDITVGKGLSNGYLVFSSASEYELFLPGGRSAGKGRYAFDSAGSSIRWISGPMTDQ
jgi:hypothetical protein